MSIYLKLTHIRYSRALRWELWGERNRQIAVYPRK